MAESNLNVVLKQKKELILENRKIVEPAADEVLIKVYAVGICGSDVHFWKNGRVANIVVENIVLGHETSGTVVKIGSKVSNLKPGDRICIEPGVSCLTCIFCKSGCYNLCADGSKQTDGSMCQYYTYPARLCYKLPENVSLEEGALVEPLSVAVHTCRRAAVSPGKSVLIIGAGAIGLCNLLVAKAYGAMRIIMTDINASRLEVAKKLGATHQICVKEKSEDAVLNEIKSLLGGAPDVTIECSGVQSSIRLSTLVTKSGGTIVLVGLGDSEVKIPIFDAVAREIDIRGVFRYTNCYPITLDLLSNGIIDVTPLITHRFSIQNVSKAFEVSHGGLDGAIKVLIQCSE